MIFNKTVKVGDRMETSAAYQMNFEHRKKLKKVFDWDKAAKLIKEHNALNASAGLQEDWEWHSDAIYIDGKPKFNCSIHLSSTWATPALCINGIFFDCYIIENQTKYNCDTVWPESSLNILIK